MSATVLNGLLIAQVVISVLLVVSVILQNRAEGLGTLFGGGGEVFRTKRGLENFLYTFTIILAVFLSLLGLYGISIYTTQLRTKEIGIRKVNGASIFSIVYLLTNDIVRLVIIATLVASPVAFYVMYQWLQNFAYKTSLHWWFFGLAGLFSMIVALLTVGWQTFSAASRNPVESIRYE